MPIWLEIQNYINSKDSIVIKIIEDAIELEGLNVTPQSKKFHLHLLANLSVFLSGLSIKNLPLNLEVYLKYVSSPF